MLSQIKVLLNIKEEPVTVTREEHLIRYNKELDNAVAQVERGEYLTQEELEKEMENW